MKIDQFDAVALEFEIRSITGCQSGGYAGLVLADTYRKYPIEAAIAAIMLLYNDEYKEEVDDFLCEWRYNFENDVADVSGEDYVKALSQLIATLKS